MNRKEIQQLLGSENRLKRRLDQGKYDFCEVWEVALGSRGRRGVMKVYDNKLAPGALMITDSTIEEFVMRKDLKHYSFPECLKQGEMEMNGRTMTYMIFEYVPNAMRLSDYLQRYGKLNRKRARIDMIELCDAVRSLHENRDDVGHNRLQADNVLISSDGIFLTGTTYMGSVQTGFGEESSDIYDLGVLYCQMLTGHLPFESEEDKTPNLEGLDDAMKAFVTKALSKEPDECFESVQEMFDALCRLYDIRVASNLMFDGLRQGRFPDAQPDPVKGKGFGEVAGMEKLKKTLSRDFLKVLQNLELAKAYGITPPNIILYGPPGCGKTYIANRLAEEAGINYSYVKPSDLGSIYMHGTQGKIAELFDKAANQAPCLLCIDEIDSLLSKRVEGVNQEMHNDEVAEWLTQLNNCTERGVYVVGMTNRIGALDEAVMRRGRFDAAFYVPLPDKEERKALFQLALSHCPVGKDVDLDILSQMTERFTSSDIVGMVKDASRFAFEQTLERRSFKPLPLTQEMLIETIRKSRSSVSASSLKQYELERQTFEGGEQPRKVIGFC